MTRAERAAHDAWGASIRRVLEQAGGVLDVQVVRREDVPELVGYALNGDATARKLLLAVNQALAGIQDAPPHRPALCAACPALLHDGRYCIAVAFPHQDDADMALGFAICEACGPTIKAAEGKVVKALAPFTNDGRMIQAPQHDAGRA